HVYGDLFSVRRDMSLNVPREKVDFAEIADLGAIKPDLYYEFLNLGFRLPAAGGSDAPWGGSAGDVRTYVYTGKPFDADEWLAGLRAGRTFVTQGPILEFTVDGERPGAELERKTGDQLRIHARVEAGYGAAPTEPLQVVANGEEIRESSRGAATLDFEIPAGSGMWIAARTK